MDDREFISYMRSAADDNVMVSGEFVNRLRAMAGIEGGDLPNSWWGCVSEEGVEWAITQYRKRTTL